MRQKLTHFHREIRRSELESIFRHKRDTILQRDVTETRLPLNAPATPRQECSTAIEDEDSNCTEADIYQQWRYEEQQLVQHMGNSAYSEAAPIITSILTALKRVASRHGMLNWRRSEIYNIFLRTTILSSIVRCVVSAERDQCPAGVLQGLTRPAVGVLKYLLTFEPLEFGEELFLQSDLLPFLRICVCQPALDKNHLSRIIAILTHMTIASTATSGKLFAVLNDMSSGFNFSAPFYAISKLPLEPTDELTINFLILLKTYLVEVERSAEEAKIKERPELEIPLNLSPHHVELCRKLAVRSVHYYLRSSFLESSEEHFSLEESLEVLRVLVEREKEDCRWLREVDYKGLVNLIRLKDCPEELIPKVLVIVDHIIYMDVKNELTFELVKGCELVPILWTFRDQYFGLVLNILSNLACQEQYKTDLDAYVHLIFLNVRLTNKAYMLYQFVYNWFSSQAFEIRNSRDSLIVKVLSESQEKDPKTIELEAAIWIRLVENNEVTVPRRIVEHENKNSVYLKDLLMGSQLESV